MFDRISEERRNCIQRREKERWKERFVVKKNRCGEKEEMWSEREKMAREGGKTRQAKYV
jgi:hypothetical protein